MKTKPPTASPREGTRQHLIETLEVNESISLAARIALDFGVSKDAIAHHTSRLRASVDGQVVRARHRYTERTWTVEIGHFITQGNGLVIACVITRLG